MPYNWKQIYEDKGDTRLYRLIGEMHSKRANRQDLEYIQKFLRESDLGFDAWQTLGESLHRTTKGAEIGFRLWRSWTKTFDKEELKEIQGRLHEIWKGFGDTAPKAPVIDNKDEPPTDVVEVEVEVEIEVDVDDEVEHTGPTNTAVVKFPKPKLMSYVPQGPYTIRFLGEEFENVDEFAIVDLLRRGLLLGAEVKYEGSWVPVPNHPAFEELTTVMRNEVRRVLEASGEPESIDDDDSSVTTQVV